MEVGFFGVFDGTVGDYASEYAHAHMLDVFLKEEALREAVSAARGAGWEDKETLGLVASAVRGAFLGTDAGLLAMCAARGYDYASSTAVVAVATGGVLTVAHLGDSRIALGRVPGGGIDARSATEATGVFLTRDHKPDLPEELRRIEAAGGSLTYLHGGKPFIRGGDFSMRQARGERPMQLNYSRALGGKDLKPYGLSAEPSIRQLRLSHDDRILILASDGLWDVADATHAVRIAATAIVDREDPAATLARHALREHETKGSVDNVTVVVIVFRHADASAAAVAPAATAASAAAAAAGSHATPAAH